MQGYLASPQFFSCSLLKRLGWYMDLLIIDSRIDTKDCAIPVLTESDFHPCHPFFIKHQLEPESFSRIYTKGVCETHPYLREVIKKIDYLLSVNGELIIDFFSSSSLYTGGDIIRPISFLMHETSLSLQDRYLLFQKINNGNIFQLHFKKLKSALPSGDSIHRWSFGIVSDGKKNERILDTIRQIEDMKIQEFEVLICGPSPSDHLPENVKVLDDSDLYRDIRIPISSKKNRIIQNAKFNNLVIIHDRIHFSKSWYRDLCMYGNYYDALCTRILDEDTKTRRVIDWAAFEGEINAYQNSNGILYNYKQWSPFIYADGGYLIIKKHLISPILLNPYLNWGEAEDYDFSRRLYLAGVLYNFYEKCYVTSASHRHQGDSTKTFQRIENMVRKKLGVLLGKQHLKRIKMMKLYRKYLEEDILNKGESRE